MKKRKKMKIAEAPAGVPEPPRPIPDVEIPPMNPDLWGSEGGGGRYPAGPMGKPKDSKKD